MFGINGWHARRILPPPALSRISRHFGMRPLRQRPRNLNRELLCRLTETRPRQGVQWTLPQKSACKFLGFCREFATSGAMLN